MALFGDRAFLLSHIRRCFVLGDESGICEHLVGNEWISQDEIDAIYSPIGPLLPIVDTEREDFAGESPELFPKLGQDAVAKRPSRVDGRIANFRNEKAAEKRLITIDVRTMRTPVLTAEERDDLFRVNESEEASSQVTKPRQSMLTHLMKGVTTENGEEANPFSSYAQFDGHHLLPNNQFSPSASQRTVASKTTANMGRLVLPSPLSKSPLRPLRIYFWYLPLMDGEVRRKPLLLQPTPGITVTNMVGLAHYQYCKEDRQPSVRSVRLNDLEVFPFDEDLNELEYDFSSLAMQDELSKYQFDAFVIVERSKVRALRESRRISNTSTLGTRTTTPTQEICVTIYMAQGHSKIKFSPDITLKDLLERVIHRRGLKQFDGYLYRLESFDTPERKLDLSRKLVDTGMRAFSLVRDHSRRDPLIPPEVSEEITEPAVNNSRKTTSPMSPVSPSQNSTSTITLNSQENLSQRQYRVQLKKGIMNRDVYLTVSQEQIEVSPVGGRAPWPRKKKVPHQYPIHLIADCEYEEPRERNTVRKVTFKILYLSPESQYAATFLDSGKTIVNMSPLVQPQSWLEELQTLAFEAQWSTTRIVHKKVITILDHVMSSLRIAYLAQSK